MSGITYHRNKRPCSVLTPFNKRSIIVPLLILDCASGVAYLDGSNIPLPCSVLKPFNKRSIIVWILDCASGVAYLDGSNFLRRFLSKASF